MSAPNSPTTSPSVQVCPNVKPKNNNIPNITKLYPNLSKLPDDLDQSLERLKNNKKINNSFGKDVINSYLKLRNSEIKEFKQKENFNKKDPITKWEKANTLDC